MGLLENPIEPVPAAVEAPSAETSAAPMKRIKRLEKPLRAKVDEDVSKVQGEIEGIKERIAEIKATIDSKQQSKQAASAEVQDARNRLSELTASFRAVMEEKKGLQEELHQGDKARDRMRADARSLREKLPYVRVDRSTKRSRGWITGWPILPSLSRRRRSPSSR